MPILITNAAFRKWFGGLKDYTAKGAVLQRLDRLRDSNHYGDSAPVGEGVTEMRFNQGGGYRIYVIPIGTVIVFLLGGGKKTGQQGDIDAAKKAAKDVPRLTLE